MADESLGKHQGSDPGVREPAHVNVGCYWLIRQIGHGGMGIVYEARDRRSGAKVALKLMPKYLIEGETHRKRFRREIQVAAKFNHPGIAKLIDSGEDDGQPYYVMEYVEGLPLSLIPRKALLESSDEQPTRAGAENDNEPLSANPRSEVEKLKGLMAMLGGSVLTRQKRGSVPKGKYFPFVAGLTIQAAEALSYAHQQGVIHRDIKPPNLILTPQGKIKILDFGLAKAVEVERVTTTGDFLGTPAYMSPEQAAGEISDIDERTDVYSLGMTLYELLTSRVPFSGDTRSICSAILHKEPVEPSRLDREIPGALNAIVLKAIEKRREHRYQCAMEFADDLRRYLSGRRVTATQGSTTWRLTRVLKKRKKGAVIVSGSLLVIAISIGGVREYLSRKATEDFREQFRRSQRYEQLIARATDAADKKLFARAIGCLQEAKRLRNTAEVRLKLWNAKRLNRLLCVLGSNAGRAQAIAFSPSARLLASGHADRTVRVWHTNYRREKWRLEGHRIHITALCFSPGEELLGSADANGDIIIWDIAKGEKTAFSKGTGVEVLSMAFVPGGSQLFIADVRGRVSISDPWARPDGQPQQHEGGTKLAASLIDANQVGGFFAAAGEGWAGTFSMASAVPSVSASFAQRLPSAIAASDSGDQLALGFQDGTILLCCRKGDSSQAVLENSREPVRGLSFTNSGRRLLSCSSSGAMAVWDIGQRSRIVTIPNECSGVSAVAAASHGKLAALAPIAGGVQLWKIDVHEVQPSARVLTPASYAVKENARAWPSVVAFSAQGRFLASGNRTGSITVWDTTTGETISSFSDSDSRVTALAFSSKKEGLLAYASKDRTVRLYDLDIRQETHRFTQLPDVVQSLAFSEDGCLLALGDRNSRIALWDVQSLTKTATIRVGGFDQVVTQLRFASGQPHLLISWTGDGRAWIWDRRAPGDMQECAPAGVSRTCSAIGPAGHQLAVVTKTGNVGIWNIRREKETEFVPHGTNHGAVRCIAFGSDGEILASGGKDMTVRLWDVRSYREALSLPTKPEQPVCLAFDPSTSQLAIGLTSGKVLLYNLSPP